MRAFVTGGTGLVGHAVIAALLAEGHEVVALVRSLDRAQRVLPDPVALRQGDVTDAASVQAAIDGCEIVFHAAGHPEQWLADDAIFDAVNVGGTRNVVAAARRAGVARFVHTSTIDVFRADAGETYDESEIDPAPKGTAYERSKQAADRVVVDALHDGLPAVFIHPSAVYGPGPAGSPGINDLIVKLRDGKAPALLPGGMPVVFAPDVGRGQLLAASAEIGARYILVDRYVTFVELAREILRALGRERVPPVVPLPIARLVSAIGERIASVTGRPPLIPRGQLHFLQWGARPSSARAQSELGWTPTPLPEGIAKTVAYLREHAPPR